MMNNCFIDINQSIEYIDMEYDDMYSSLNIVNHPSILFGFQSFRNDVRPGGYSSDVTFLTETERSLFFTAFLIILGIAIFGNIAAIHAMRIRKCRFLQKTCVTSLAISDMLMATAYGVNNMETFSHPQINWTLGSFMCSLIPFLQMLGITASTSAIVVIALDRYRNVVQSVSYRWNPQTNSCIMGFIFIWTLCIGSSMPIYNMFEIKLSWILFKNGTSDYHREPMHFCISLVKEKLMIYYILMASCIFTPLFIIFIWLYVHIAQLIWTHRKPPSCKKYLNESSTCETSITYIKNLEIRNQPKKPPAPKINKLHVERKIRTFKIVISLMLIFFVCRIPFWTFNILKLVGNYNEPKHWIMTYCFNGLALLNCALNPFLYTFVNQTLQFISRVNRAIANFTCDICCCCFNSSDFDHFERENPFLFINNGTDTTKLGACKIPKVKLKDGPIKTINAGLRKY